MRVLVSSTANAGHFSPLVPFAQALAAAGHDVAVAAPASFADAVAAAGLAHRPFADVPPDVLGGIFAGLPSLSFEEADRTVVREVFGRLDARAALPGISATIADWEPDLVLREPAELGSLAAAEAAGVPHAMVSIGMTAMLDLVEGWLTEPFAELDELAGLPAGRCAEACRGAAVLTCVPGALDGATGQLGRTPQRFRVGETSIARGSPPPAWGDPDAPLVYVTFGSVAGGLAPFAGAYVAVVDALAEVPCRVLLTTGRGLDPATLGPVPDHVRVEQWWPQGDLMPVTDAMVGHGGFGTTMTAVLHGVPQVVVPLFTSDQRLNATHVAAAGAGIHLEGGLEALGELPEALAALLESPGPRAGAQQLAAAAAALPPVTHAVASLEELAR